MKRYPESHLETIDPSWIAAVEEMIERGPNKYGEYGCPPGQKRMIYGWWYGCRTCHTYFGYEEISSRCPCFYFNCCDNAIKESLNLIAQWKSWAGIE